MANCFQAADILLPQHISMKKWACVACDQFSSQPEYWEQVAEFVGEEPSTFRMIIPEAWLDRETEDAAITVRHAAMDRYLAQNLFRTCRRSFIYIERTLISGKKRQGLVGQVDLDAYDFNPDSGAIIRATEATVRERIPPRMKLLRGASMEFPHVLLLCDDSRDAIMSAARTVLGETVYDFDLQQEGGHITGRLISGLGVGIVNAAVSDYIRAVTSTQDKTGAMAFAVGDGNHSLASAKACWEEIKQGLTAEEQLVHPARYALVELENIHDPAIVFEPIHRLIRGVDAGALVSLLRQEDAGEGYPIEYVTAGETGIIHLDRRRSPLALAILQPILDRFAEQQGGTMDYIHGADVVRQLSREQGTVGIILPAIEKQGLFPGVIQGGVLPRKTFSMGEAREKRYYLEGKMRV